MKYHFEFTYIEPYYNHGMMVHRLEARNLQTSNGYTIRASAYTKDLLSIIDRLGLFCQKLVLTRTMDHLKFDEPVNEDQWGFIISTDCNNPEQALQLYACQLKALSNGRRYRPIGLNLFIECSAQMLSNMTEPFKPGTVDMTDDDIKELTTKFIEKMYPKGVPDFQAFEDLEMRIQKDTKDRVELRPADATEITKQRNWGPHMHMMLRIGYWKSLVTVRAFGFKPFEITILTN